MYQRLVDVVSLLVPHAQAADGECGLEVFGDGAARGAVLPDQRMTGLDGREKLREVR